jgi:hypothetical protein
MNCGIVWHRLIAIAPVRAGSAVVCASSAANRTAQHKSNPLSRTSTLPTEGGIVPECMVPTCQEGSNPRQRHNLLKWIRLVKERGQRLCSEI